MNRKTRKLNELNNTLDAQINDENQAVFTDMICYLRGSDISEYDIEVVRQDLTEMVLSAQSRGENINSVIAGDYKEFCDNVIDNLPPRTVKQKIVDALDIICWVLSILFLIHIVTSKEMISIIEGIISRKEVDWNISVSIGSAVSMVFMFLLANLIVNIIIKNVFRKEKKLKRLLGFFAGAVFMLLLIMIPWFGKSTLFTINVFLACAVTGVLFVIHKVLETISIS